MVRQHPFPVLCVLSRFSHVRLFETLWAVSQQAPLAMGSFRQEYWSGLPFPSSGDLLDPGIEPMSLKSPALAGGFFSTSTIWEALISLISSVFYNLSLVISFNCIVLLTLRFFYFE